VLNIDEIETWDLDEAQIQALARNQAQEPKPPEPTGVNVFLDALIKEAEYQRGLG
jgi:hypothetical protein